MKTIAYLLSGALFATALTLAEARTWTNSSGKQLEAEFLGSTGGQVQLKRQADGKSFTIPLSSLSEADQAFVKEQASSPGAAEKSSSGAGGTRTGSGTDWPGWRGADQSDISPDTGLMKSWPREGPKLLWTYENGGKGYSSCAVVGGKFYTLGARDKKEILICLDAATGEEVWTADVGEDPEKGYSTGWGAGPRSTPTVSEGFAYALGVAGDLVSVNAETGKVNWRKNLVSDFGGKVSKWGYSESPTVDGGKVLVTPGGEGGAIVALDKTNGREIWRSKDLTDLAEYSSVVVADVGGKRQYIQLFMNTLAGVDAESGDVIWKADWEKGKTAVIPTPIYKDGHVYMTSGYGAGCMLVNIAGGTAEVVWENTEMKNHHGGVVLVDDHVYGFSDGAGLICQNFKTGELVWNEKGRNTQKGAVHCADGMLYCLDENEGRMTLAEASPRGFEEKGSFKLPRETELREGTNGKIWSHPVVINGKLYLRDQDLIFCYDVKG